MKVLYYTSTAFLDISAEIINVLKSLVDLHVLIEITAGSKNENIINVDTLPENEVFISPARLLSQKDYQYLEPYFKGWQVLISSCIPAKAWQLLSVHL